jgi:hypothetical protein
MRMARDPKRRVHRRGNGRPQRERRVGRQDARVEILRFAQDDNAFFLLLGTRKTKRKASGLEGLSYRAAN